MKMNSKKTARLAERLMYLLRQHSVACCFNYRVHNSKQQYQVFSGAPFESTGQACDRLIKACNILGIDLTKSGIKNSRGHEVFLP